jgi:hypothetical protein
MSPKEASNNRGQTFDFNRSANKNSKPNRVIIQARDLSNTLLNQ